MTDNDFSWIMPGIFGLPSKRYTSENQSGFLPFTKKMKMSFDPTHSCSSPWEEVEMKDLASCSQADDMGIYDLSTHNSSMDLDPSSRTKKKQFTVPKPFTLNTELRARLRRLKEKKVLYCRSTSMKSSQQSSCNSWDSFKTPVPTVPQPFSLRTESRGSIKEQKLQDKLSALKEIDSLSREFRAKPMPSYNVFLPPKPVIAPTQPVPFNLQTDMRNKENCHPNQTMSVNFKAKPMPSFEKPYLPLASEKQLTIPCDLKLHSERRALERRSFQEELQFRHLERAQSEEAVQIRKREIERENLKLFRKTLEFHARAMPNLNPFEVQRSNKQLTKPVSPKLGPKRRAI